MDAKIDQEQAAGNDWIQFSPQERESFFDSIARHQRAAGRVALLANACALGLAFVVAVLMSPLLYGLIGLVLDLLNFAIPMPDLIGNVTNTVSDLIDTAETVSVARWLQFGVIASLPGLALMWLAIHALGRVMRAAMASEVGCFSARAPDPTRLAEQRFANVVAEMAIAAGVPAPRVLVSESEAVNAAAFGADSAHATVVVTTGLLAELDRAELQGVAASMVGSIANGDMAVGARVATILSLFGLIAKLAESFGDREAARRFLRLLLHAFNRKSSRAYGELAMLLTNPFAPAEAGKGAPAADTGKVPWRTLAWMPLVGPLVISGFFGGLLCTIALGPLLALGWRRRKYLGDATAVRLTRDPDALGNALAKMRGLPVEGAFGAWVAHMSVLPSGLIGARSILGGSSAPMSPALDRRLKALGVMGAHVQLRAPRTVPAWAWLVLGPVGALLAVLMGMVVFGLLYVSAALSGLFTWFPAVLVHALLR